MNLVRDVSFVHRCGKQLKRSQFASLNSTVRWPRVLNEHVHYSQNFWCNAWHMPLGRLENSDHRLDHVYRVYIRLIEICTSVAIVPRVFYFNTNPVHRKLWHSQSTWCHSSAVTNYLNWKGFYIIIWVFVSSNRPDDPSFILFRKSASKSQYSHFLVQLSKSS
jgi:hypothetical protein